MPVTLDDLTQQLIGAPPPAPTGIIDPDTGQPVPGTPDASVLPPTVPLGAPNVRSLPSPVTDSAQPVLGALPKQPWYKLTQPSIPPPGQPLQTPAYGEASNDPGTGMPSATGHSLTKLGKLVTVLRAAGMGAAAGSQAHDFGGGFLAAQQNWNEQAAQNQAQASRALGLQQQRQSLTMVDTPWGPMPYSMASAIMSKAIPATIAAGSRENVADTAAESRQKVAGTAAMSREKVANIMAQAKRDTDSGIALTEADVQKYNLPRQFIGKKAKISDIAASERAGVFENIPMMTDKGLVVVNRKTGNVRQATGDDEQTYASAQLAMPEQIADPNNPGHSVIVPKGQSFGQEGTQSAALQVPRAALKAALPKNIGDQYLAYNTALRHADLLEQAVKELNNPSSQTLSGLINRIKTEFGATGATSAQVIADAYGREITKMLSSNHITDNEIGTVGRTLNPSVQTQEQVLDVLGKYRALAQSKRDVLDQTVRDANEAATRKNPPAKKNATAPPPPKQGDHPSWFHPLGR